MVRRGFSLWEVTIVLALVLLLSAVPLAYRAMCDRAQVALEVQKLVLLFRSLQQQAIATGQEFTVFFDCSKNQYRVSSSNVSGQESHTLSGAVFGYLPGAYGPPSSPKKLLYTPVTFVDKSVRFFSDGTISSGVVYIKGVGDTLGYAVSYSVAQVSYIRRYQSSHDGKRWRLLP